MKQCWCQSPDKRPSFQDLVDTITRALDGVAGYLDLSAADKGWRYDHLGSCSGKGYDKLAGVLLDGEKEYNHLDD